MLTGNYKEDLLKRLSDPEYAAEYLNAALEEGEEKIFLLALQDVAEARGVNEGASKTNLSRMSTYLMLFEQGNPQLSNLNAVLETLGLRLAVQAK